MKLSNTALFYRMEREKAMYWLSTKKAKIIMLLPTLMIYAVFIIIPVFIACYYSFTDYSGLGKASFVGIKNYVAMFHDKLFLIALKNTFLVLLFSVIFLIVGSFMAALLMNKNFHGNAFFKMVIFAPYVIAPIIIGIIWGYILNPNYGLVNSVLHKIGLDMLAIEWIGGTKWSPLSLAIVFTWQVLGFHGTIFLSGITPLTVGAQDNYSIWAFETMLARYGFFEKLDGLKDGSISWNNEDFIHYFEKVEEMREKGTFTKDISNIGYFEAKEQFLGGNAAM